MSKGLSIIVREKEQFESIKKLLGEDILYLDWVPKMAEIETGIIIWAKKKTNFSLGSIGSTEYQREAGIRCVDFNQYFK